MPEIAPGFEAHLERRVRVHSHASLLGDMLDYHFGYGSHGPARHGKRLRPNMTIRVATGEGAGAEDAFDAAAAIEILHNYSLVHDDIEDRDELRHGRKTLWATYGIPHAINAGDAMCAVSSLALTRAAERHPPERVVRMVETLHDAHRIMCDGQTLDLTFESTRDVDLPAYQVMIGAKTAALFEAACRLGALTAACDEAAIETYASLGRAFGMAFQIHDDISGIWGATDATGKTARGDIVRRKWTFPIVWALGRPDCAAREAVARVYAGEAAGDADAESERVVAALDELGAREAARRAAAEHLAVIERFPQSQLREFLLAPLGLAAP